ncbi:hypothetical protein DWB84_14820 [Saccharophagus sp. K07]|nr:hypothetical protein [Saccharophagus sp. K07]
MKNQHQAFDFWELIFPPQFFFQAGKKIAPVNFVISQSYPAHENDSVSGILKCISIFKQQLKSCTSIVVQNE